MINYISYVFNKRVSKSQQAFVYAFMNHVKRMVTSLTQGNPVFNAIVFRISVFMMNLYCIVRMTDNTKKRLPFKRIKRPSTRRIELINPFRRFLINSIALNRTESSFLRRLLFKNYFTHFAFGFFCLSQKFFNELSSARGATVFRSIDAFICRYGNHVFFVACFTDLFLSILKRHRTAFTRAKLLISSFDFGEIFFRTKIAYMLHKLNLTYRS